MSALSQVETRKKVTKVEVWFSKTSFVFACNAFKECQTLLNSRPKTRGGVHLYVYAVTHQQNAITYDFYPFAYS